MKLYSRTSIQHKHFCINESRWNTQDTFFLWIKSKYTQLCTMLVCEVTFELVAVCKYCVHRIKYILAHHHHHQHHPHRFAVHTTVFVFCSSLTKWYACAYLLMESRLKTTANKQQLKTKRKTIWKERRNKRRWK